jgi:predicted nucleic acid-binding Zn ribbon protein
MAENEHRFGVSAIDELNGHRRARRERTKNFALLMTGLFILIALLYVQIIW